MTFSKIIFSLLLTIPFICTSQKIIQLEKENGVYYFNNVKVNGIPMRMIFDTGASDLSLSITEAKLMLKHGKLKEADFIGVNKYQIANGDIIEGYHVIIKEIDIDGFILTNINASIISSEAEVLMGQSILEKLGIITFDPKNQTLTILSKNSSTSDNTSISKLNSKSLKWLTDIDEAYTYSKYSGKPIFAYFTGSDWCGWCKKLNDELLNSETFIKWANEKVILLELDFPRYKIQSFKLQEHNKNIANMFQVNGYPTIWLFSLDKNLKSNQYNINALGKTGYNSSLAEFMNGLNQIVK